MKNLVIILLALLAISSASAQSSKILSQTFNANNIEVLYTPSFVEVEYKEIEGSRIILETRVESSCKLSTLEFIVEQGLVSPLYTTNETGEGFISFPNADKLNSIFIKGVQVETTIKITVYMPKSIGMLATK
jgi:hypothetical protein